MPYMDTALKNSLLSMKDGYRNELMLTRNRYTRMDDQMKGQPDQKKKKKELPKSNHP